MGGAMTNEERVTFSNTGGDNVNFSKLYNNPTWGTEQVDSNKLSDMWSLKRNAGYKIRNSQRYKDWAAQQAAPAEKSNPIDWQKYRDLFHLSQKQAQEGEQKAQQQIQGLNASQQATDSKAVTPIVPTNVAGGSSYSISSAKPAPVSAGVATPVAPISAVNAVADSALNGSARSAAAAQQNQANITGSGTNQFTLPSTNGITFGGK